MRMDKNDYIRENNLPSKPFLKWAGGKSQLIKYIRNSIPDDFLKKKEIFYIEPFVGSGAVLFFMLENFLNIKAAIINDINSDLMNAYKVVRDNPEALICLLKQLQKDYNKVRISDRKFYYLEKRKEFNLRSEDIIHNAGLLIFLNRTCYNGLFRVNSNNEFNVPFGDYKNPKICNANTIFACSKLLKKVTILNEDFTGTYKYIGRDTFYYFDPPYKPLSKTSSFTSYSSLNFDDRQQERLAQFCSMLNEKGIKWLVSNSDPKNTGENNDYFEKLYRGFHIRRIKARRNINSLATGRGAINELLIANYKMPLTPPQPKLA